MTLNKEIERNLKEVRQIISSGKTKYLVRPSLERWKSLCLDLRKNYGATYKEIQFYLKRYHASTFNLDYLTRTIRKWQQEQ